MLESGTIPAKMLIAKQGREYGWEFFTAYEGALL